MRRFALTAVGIIALLAAGHLAAQEEPPAQEQKTQPAAAPMERYLPAKVLFYMKVRDSSALPDYFKKSVVYKIWQEKDIQNIAKEQIDEVKQKIEESFKEFEEESGIKVKDILEVFSGEATFALIDLDVESFDGPGPPKLDFVLTIDPGDKKEQLVKILETAQKAIMEDTGEDGPAPSVEKHRGHKIYNFGDAQVTLSATWLDAKWVLSFNKATLLGIIERYLAKEIPANSLEKDKKFATVYGKCGGGKEEFFFYYDTSSLARRFKESMPTEVGKIFADMGLFDSLVSGYGALIEPDGTSREMSYTLASETHKILDLIGKSKVNTTLYLPTENIILWLSASYDLTAGFNYIMNLLATGMREEGEDLAESLKELEEQLGFKLEEDLIKSLGTSLNIYIMLPQGGGAFPEIALTADIAKSQLIEKTIEKFAEKMGEDLKSVDYQGHKLYYFFIDKFAGKETDIPYLPTFTCAKNMLLAGSSPQVVKRMIGNLEKPLKPTGDIKTALAKVPKDAYQFAFVDTKKAFSYLYNTLLPYMHKKQKDSMPEFLDPANLPPVEVITKHLSYVYSYSTRDAGGSYSEVVSPAGPVGIPLAGVAITAAIAVPNLLESKGAANEAMVIASLRTLCTAQEVFNARFGNYAGGMRALAEKDLIGPELAKGVRGGYIFEMQADGPNKWHSVARPINPGKGKPYFYVDQTGVIRESKTADIGPESPVWGGK